MSELHQLVTDDVESDQEYTILNQLGTDDFGDVEGDVVDLGSSLGAASGDVTPHVATAADATKRGMLCANTKGPSVHDKQPHVALLGCGKVFLRDDEPVAADRVDHLIEVGDVALADQEDAGTARALQRL